MVFTNKLRADAALLSRTDTLHRGAHRAEGQCCWEELMSLIEPCPPAFKLSALRAEHAANKKKNLENATTCSFRTCRRH